VVHSRPKIAPNAPLGGVFGISAKFRTPRTPGGLHLPMRPIGRRRWAPGSSLLRRNQRARPDGKPKPCANCHHDLGWSITKEPTPIHNLFSSSATRKRLCAAHSASASSSSSSHRSECPFRTLRCLIFRSPERESFLLRADEVIELRFSFQIEADRYGQVHPIARQFTRRRGKRLCAAQQRQRLLVERGRAG
jgi:hypothetical protein